MESAVAAHGDRALPLPGRGERPALGIHTLGAAHPAVTRLDVPPTAVVDGGGGGEVDGRARVELNRTCETHARPEELAAATHAVKRSCAAETRETRVRSSWRADS